MINGLDLALPARIRIAALVGLMMLLSTAVELTGYFLSRPYSPYQVVWTRYVTHLLFLVIALAARRQLGLIRTRRLGLQIFRALLMLGMPICFILAVAHLRADDAWSVFWVSPLICMALAAVGLREKISRISWIAGAVGLVGAGLILRPDTALVSGVLIWPLGMALCFSVYVVLTRSMHTETTAANLFYTAVGVLVPLSFELPLVWRTPVFSDLALMGLIGLFGLAFLYVLDKVCEAGSVGAWTPYLLIQPVWTLAATALLFAQRPGKLALLGVLIILVSAGMTFLVYLVRSRRAGLPAQGWIHPR